MATHSSIFAWKIPWTEDPGRLQSMGLQTAEHNWNDLTQSEPKLSITLRTREEFEKYYSELSKLNSNFLEHFPLQTFQETWEL